MHQPNQIVTLWQKSGICVTVTLHRSWCFGRRIQSTYFVIEVCGCVAKFEPYKHMPLNHAPNSTQVIQWHFAGFDGCCNFGELDFLATFFSGFSFECVWVMNVLFADGGFYSPAVPSLSVWKWMRSLDDISDFMDFIVRTNKVQGQLLSFCKRALTCWTFEIRRLIKSTVSMKLREKTWWLTLSLNYYVGVWFTLYCCIDVAPGPSFQQQKENKLLWLSGLYTRLSITLSSHIIVFLYSSLSLFG